MKKIFHLCSLAFFVASFGFIHNTQAQDARFSQAYSAPQRINPALIGAFQGNWRVGLNYRTQWGAVLGKAYNTFSAMGETKFGAFKDDFVGLGISATTDRAGMGGYNSTDVGVGISYMKKLSQRNRYSLGKSESFLIAAGQIGMGQRGVNWDQLSYSTQWVGQTGNYDLTIPSGESADVRQNKMYVDLNAGLMWYGIFGNRRSAYVGASVFHINKPDISLFNRPAVDSTGTAIGIPVEPLYRRFVVHAGGEILLGDRGSAISLVPAAVAMFQGPSMDVTGGLGLRYQQPKQDDLAFKMGVWARVTNALESQISADALIFYVGMDYQGFQMMFSYDVTLSTLSAPINGRGAMEVSLIYVNDSDNRRNPGCPAFN